MTDSRPTVVWDSWAGDLHPAYLEKLPHITFESVEMPDVAGTRPHTHGAIVASCYASQFTEDKNIVFLRDMDSQGRGSPDMRWGTLSEMKAINPRRVIRSAGADDMDDPGREASLREFYSDNFLEHFVAWLEEQDVDIFFAAGNSDRNDEDTDTAFPQRILAGMTNRVHVIGACNVESIPAPFSSDDRERPETILGLWLGVDRAGIDPFDGEWTGNDGTSFAAPTAAGDAEAAGVHGTSVRPWTKNNAVVPPELSEMVPHAKAGLGSMMRVTQANLTRTQIFPFGQRVRSGLLEFAPRPEPEIVAP